MQLIKLTTNINALLLTVIEDISKFGETLDKVGLGLPHLEQNEIMSSSMLYTINENKTSRLDAYTNCLSNGLDLFVYDTTLDLSIIFEKLPTDNQVWTGIKYSTDVLKLISPTHDLVSSATTAQSSISLPTTNLAITDAYALKIDKSDLSFSVVKLDKNTLLPFICMELLPAHFRPREMQESTTTISKLKMLVDAMTKHSHILQRRFEYMKSVTTDKSSFNHQVTLTYSQTTLDEDFPHLDEYIKNDRRNGVDILNLKIAASTLQYRLDELSNIVELLFENPLLIEKIGKLKNVKFERPLILSQNAEGKIIIQMGQNIIAQVQTDFFDVSLADLSLFALGTLGAIVAIIKATLFNKPQTVYSVQAIPSRQRENLPYYVNEVNLPSSKSPIECCC